MVFVLLIMILTILAINSWHTKTVVVPLIVYSSKVCTCILLGILRAFPLVFTRLHISVEEYDKWEYLDF